MKFFTLILFFTIASVMVAQTDDNSNINQSEKKRLENKFKALSTFYIDDTGLVVYEGKEASSINQSFREESKPVVKSDKPISNNNVIIVSEPVSEPYIIKEEPVVFTKEENVKPPVSVYEEEVIIKPKEEVVIIDKQPVSIPKTKDQPKKDQPKVTKDNKATAQETNIEDKDAAKKTVKPQGSIFDRRRKSQYKNMEEAALAVESLLSELKKEQSSIKSSGSMSSRLSRGVTKDLRKKDSNATSTSIVVEDTSYEDGSTDESEFGLEPSYFINGVQVDKIEINKLQKGDIINREIRTRNTVTNNPNGEVWYTVKKETDM